MGKPYYNTKEALLMDVIVTYILQGQTSFTPDVLLRFFLLRVAGAGNLFYPEFID